MTNYIFEDYDDNLDQELLDNIPLKQLFEVAMTCEGLCEVCRTYLYNVYDRLEGNVKS